MSFDHIQRHSSVRAAPTPLIDGIDVDQLLRDIGEASAWTSPIELFRLCLSAQRVLVQVSPNGGAR